MKTSEKLVSRRGMIFGTLIGVPAAAIASIVAADRALAGGEGTGGGFTRAGSKDKKDGDGSDPECTGSDAGENCG